MKFTGRVLKFFLVMTLAVVATLCSSQVSFSQEVSYQQATETVTYQSQGQNNWLFPIPSEYSFRN
jgi:hypothetical protein